MPPIANARVAPEYRDSVSPVYQQVVAADPGGAPALFTEYSETRVACGTVPRAQYTSPEFAKLELERMWPRVWQVAGREEQIPEPGDCLLYESPGASLLVVRGEDMEIRAFYNSCRHRGMKLCSANTSVARIACPFHGFTWNLDGSLAHIPSKWDFPDLRETNMDLPAVRVGVWGGFVFINRDPDAVPLANYLGRLPAHFAAWPRDDVYLAIQIRKTIQANWKTCIEGFLEAFHLAGIHSQALPFGGDSSTQYDVWPDDENVSRFLEPTGIQSDQYRKQLSEQEVLDASLRIMFGGAETPQLPPGTKARQFMAAAMRSAIGESDGKDYSALSDTEAADAAQYSLFPNFILFRSLGYPYAYRFLPLRDNPNAATFDFMIFKPKPSAGEPIPEVNQINLGPDDTFGECGAFPPWLGQIYDQDTAGLALCQAGLVDGGTADVVFSSYQEVRIRHLHQTLARYIGQSAD
jgi:phenylpropionate dioxygenase-like ring-hydroxylating dioxygenase large terminal subunit